MKEGMFVLVPSNQELQERGMFWVVLPGLESLSWIQLELQCLEALRGPDIDLEARIPVVNKTDGKLLVGDAAPRRADLEVWLQAHPEFTVDPRFLAVSVIA